jgi:hypothetical protein
MNRNVELELDGGNTVVSGKILCESDNTYYVGELVVSMFLANGVLRDITGSLHNKDFIFFENELLNRYLHHGDTDPQDNCDF